MLNCFYIGAALYCGSAGGPVADIQQPVQNYPTEYMARQMVRSKRNAPGTLIDCPDGRVIHTGLQSCDRR
jgi:hypothetical protein